MTTTFSTLPCAACSTIARISSRRSPTMLAFKAKYRIGAVNSINWGRIVAQVVYYFKGYFAATKSNAEKVSFAVPSGNFGNVLAGHIARMMGLPIRRLIVATNENDVLDEFFRTGRYRPRGSVETLADVEPVDGYFQSLQLRAFPLRPALARSGGGEGTDAQGRARRRFRYCRMRRMSGSACPHSVSSPGAVPTPIALRRFVRCGRNTGLKSIRTPPTA